MNWIDFLQWPAMAVTILAAWFVGSQRRPRRMIGFILFLISNVLWTAWGIYAAAWALILLQGFLAITNLRGLRKNAKRLAGSRLRPTPQSGRS